MSTIEQQLSEISRKLDIILNMANSSEETPEPTEYSSNNYVQNSDSVGGKKKRTTKKAVTKKAGTKKVTSKK